MVRMGGHGMVRMGWPTHLVFEVNDRLSDLLILALPLGRRFGILCELILHLPYMEGRVSNGR